MTDSFVEADQEASVVRDYAMIVRTADLSVYVTDLNEFAANLERRVQEVGGYFEQNDIENYSSAYSTDRYGKFVVRVPQTELDTFLGDVEGACFVTSKSLSSEDVSLQYVDIQAHIDALKTQQETLMRLLEEADDISATLQIEERLSQVNYEIDSYVRQQRTLAGKVSYSTIRIFAHEERNIEHPIRLAFEVNFKDRMIEGIEDTVDTFVGILTAIPTILIVCAFGIFSLWLLRKIWRKVFKRNGVKQKVRYMLVPMVQATEFAETPQTKEPETRKAWSKEPENVSGKTDGNSEMPE